MRNQKLALVLSACAVILLGGAVVSGRPAEEPAPGPVTFHREISRLLQQSCQQCHRPGGIAPFPLITYEDIAARASSVKGAVLSGSMPPWKPTAGCGDFTDVRALKDQDKSMLVGWLDSGLPKGNPADEPPPKVFPDGWTIGTPDAALPVAKAYPLAGAGEDAYRCFVLPFTAESDVFVSGVDLVPGAPSVVHHMIAYTDPDGVSSQLAGNDPYQSYECFGSPGFLNTQIISAWAPGGFGHMEPEGSAFKLTKGTKLVLQVHYHRDGKDHEDLSKAGLFFSKVPVKHTLRSFFLLNFNFLIPAGSPHHDVVADLTIPFDMHVTSVAPHMHLLGRQIRLEAVEPGAKAAPACMVDIQDWDFSWQSNYRYREPVLLKKGARLHMSGYFDNSESNPAQPSQPPKPVHFGESTTDEMFLALITYYPEDEQVVGFGEAK